MTDQFSSAEPGRQLPLTEGEAPGPSCAATPGCITCGDVAVQVVVARLLPDRMAAVIAGAGEEEVSVALVDAKPGDTILVHAGEAIALINEATAHIK